MYYYKCPVCNNYNEVSDEHLAYCTICTARFDNSFQNWSKKHPEGTFEDYLKKFCVDQKKMEKEVGTVSKYEIKVKKSYRKHILYSILILVSIVGVLMAAGVVNLPFLNELRSLLSRF